MSAIYLKKQLTTEYESSWPQCETRGTKPSILSNQSRSLINYRLSNLFSSYNIWEHKINYPASFKDDVLYVRPWSYQGKTQGSGYQNGWIFRKIPNGLWPLLCPPPLFFVKSYNNHSEKLSLKPCIKVQNLQKNVGWVFFLYQLPLTNSIFKILIKHQR